jgi:hypothetical protein
MGVCLLAEYFEDSHCWQHWESREKFARGRWNCPNASQNLAGTHAKGRVRGKGARGHAAARAEPPVNTRRGAVEGGSGQVVSERANEQVGKKGVPVFARY